MKRTEVRPGVTVTKLLDFYPRWTLSIGFIRDQFGRSWGVIVGRDYRYLKMRWAAILV